MTDTNMTALIISTVSAFAAAIAAIAAWRAVRATNRGTDAQIIILLRNEFSSSDMREALEMLRAFKDEHGGIFASEFINLKISDPKRFQELNNSRREVNGYHKKVYMLNKNKIIEDAVISSLISKNQFKFLMEVLEPYERAYANDDQNVKIDEDFFQWISKHSN